MPSDPAIRRDTSKPATFFMTSPPNRRVSAVAGQEPHAEHVIAHRTTTRARRTGETGGYSAADRGADGVARRVERETLPSLRQERLNVREPRATTSGEDEFGGVVVDDAGVITQVERLCLDGSAVKALCITARHPQRSAARARIAQPVGDVGGEVGAGHGRSESWQVGEG